MKSADIQTLAFYNLENLFDTRDDPYTLDDDFLPDGELQWSESRYRRKLNRLGKAILGIGTDQAGMPPAVVGMAEVENAAVLRDLLQVSDLRSQPYAYVHADSPDERGIDTALIYHQEFFDVQEKEVYPLLIYSDSGERDYTRDILRVSGSLKGDHLHVLVNHWPSRRKGSQETDVKRLQASALLQSVCTELYAKDPQARIILMGDFNDDPFSPSIQQLVDSGFHNPMQELSRKYRLGSLVHQARWNLFDQILLSSDFLHKTPGRHEFLGGNVYNDHQLKEWNGRFKGNPFRTYAGRRYLGGTSDHFPVYVQLRRN